MKKMLFLLGTFSLFFVPSSSFAISIEYSLTSLGNKAYQYDYMITNDGSLGAGVDVNLFDIAFDPSLYEESSLTIVTPPALAANWIESILFSAPGVHSLYDAYALGDGIFTSVSGFAVQFNWLGSASGPGAQAFTIYDPVTFGIIEEGMTTPVPEPGTLFFVGAGLTGLGFFRRRGKKNI